MSNHYRIAAAHKAGRMLSLVLACSLIAGVFIAAAALLWAGECV